VVGGSSIIEKTVKPQIIVGQAGKQQDLAAASIPEN